MCAGDAHRHAPQEQHGGEEIEAGGLPRRWVDIEVLVRVQPLVPGADALLLLACDGLWEVLSPPEAAGLALSYVRRPDAGGLGLSPTDAARRLAEMALKLGSSDNVTALLVVLPTAPPEYQPPSAEGDESNGQPC